MKIPRAFKTQLHTNHKQETHFRQCAGTARFVFNWALADRIERYEQGLKTNKYEQKKRFNASKPAWIRDYPYTILEQEFENVDSAYKNFFGRIKKGEEEKGFPKFKSKHTDAKAFTLRGGIRVERDRIKLPKIGWVKLAERNYLPKGKVKILSANISERAGKWYVSVQVEQDVPEPQSEGTKIVGVDLGIKTLVTCSDGKTFENPKALAKHERKLKRLQREFSRRIKGSHNRAKTKAKQAKCHFKISNIRKHAIHEATSYLTKTKSIRTIVIEDLNVSGMLQNHHLAKSIGDASFGELRRQIEYKSLWRGKQVVIADRFYASSKLCSACGSKNTKLQLSDRSWVCMNCGVLHDRDENAAKNLELYAGRKQHPSACGVTMPEDCTVKQEVSSRTLSVSLTDP